MWERRSKERRNEGRMNCKERDTIRGGRETLEGVRGEKGEELCGRE
jgi:hypothetical protein